MPCCPPLLGMGPRLRSFLRDYDALRSLALALIYLQIGCALIGSLGALFNGVLVINLVIGLFAVVAIESSSQRLGRTYAVLLFFAVVLDVAFFILFSCAICGTKSLACQGLNPGRERASLRLDRMDFKS